VVSVRSSRGRDVRQAIGNKKGYTEEWRTGSKFTYLDEFGARPQKGTRVVHVLDDLHRTNDVEPLRLLHEHLGWRMSEGQPREARICRGVARRDADILC
jgi:hypothetical protein